MTAEWPEIELVGSRLLVLHFTHCTTHAYSYSSIGFYWARHRGGLVVSSSTIQDITTIYWCI